MKPTRAAILSLAVLVGFSVSEAMRSAPGLIFDMAELKARAQGVKKQDD